MNVVITGGAGFVGSHLAELYVANGDDVTVIDDLSTGKHQNLAAIRKRITFVQNDYAEALDSVRQRIDLFIHCAAIADIAGNWHGENRHALFVQNVSRWTIALDLLLEHDVGHVAFMSTAAYYGDTHSPYLASKISGEAYTKAYATKAGWRWSVLRPVGMLGPRLHHGHIADFVKAVNRDGRVVCKDNGEGIKPYVDVRDATREMFRVLGAGLSATHDIASALTWTPKQSLELMRARRSFEVVYTDAHRGWVGDPLGIHHIVGRSIHTPTPLAQSVNDTLDHLDFR